MNGRCCNEEGIQVTEIHISGFSLKSVYVVRGLRDNVATYILLIRLAIIMSGSSSFGSDSETLFTCYKFYFEEWLLEQLVRSEHIMEIHDQMMKRWEDLFSSKLDRMDAAIKQTEIFVESLRNTDIQEQSRQIDSYEDILENFEIRLKN